MGTVYKKSYTKPLPVDAELFTRKGQRFARWKDNKGRKQTTPVTTGKDGSDRIVFKAGTYTAKYRNGGGHVVEIKTGCRDEMAARSILADMERRAELVKSGVMTKAEDAIADYQQIPLTDHIAAYIEHLRATRASTAYREDQERYLNRLAADCGFSKLLDLNQLVLQRWLSCRQDEGMSARSHNAYRAVAVAFCNWCIKTDRLTINPFKDIPKANEKIDSRRKRRALTENELIQLLDVAQKRPLLDAMTIRRGKRKGEAVAKLRETTQKRLKILGRERSLIYKSLLLTGLRKKELASLTIGQLDFQGSVAYATLSATDEKNRQGSDIPLRADLAEDLQQWLAHKLDTAQKTAKLRGEPIPVQLAADMPLFTVPTALVKILDRDLILAGIPKIDERGRSVDVHALRHSFGTHLSKGGVAPRVAQAAMRHSSIDLTMNLYTDPKLLDVAGALDALPALPLNSEGHKTERQKATGTDGSYALAPQLAPKLDKSGASWAKTDRPASTGEQGGEFMRNVISPVNDITKNTLTRNVNRCLAMGDTGLEPVTSCMSSRRSSQLS